MTYDEELISQGLCPEVIPIVTEDGPATGRCEAPIVDFACEGHTAEILGWLSLSEPERAHWERQRDHEGR